MRKHMVIALLFALFNGATLAADTPEAAAPPWFLKEIATLTEGGGRWVADNGRYKSEEEPYDSYITVWTAGFGGTTMRGRLFGVEDGKESADFWEFRLSWHPGERRAYMQQFGWGGQLGSGLTWFEDGTTKSLQTFFTMDGSTSEVGHVSHFADRNTHVTSSFDVVDEKWLPRRTYRWVRIANPE